MEESTKSRTERPLRVTMIIQRFRPYFTGQGVQLEQLSHALARRGVEVTITTALRSDDAPLRETLNGFAVRRLRTDLGGAALPRRAFGPMFAARAGVDLWSRRRDIDLVHVHGVNDALYSAWAFGRALGVPVVLELTLSGADDPRAVRQSKNRLTALRYAIYRRMDAYVAISPQLATALRPWIPPAAPLRTIPQGVDLERFAPPVDRGAVRRELGLPDGPLCVFVGTLVERKGIDLLLSAWRRIAEAVPSAHLVLVGNDRFAGESTAESFLQRALDGLPARVLGGIIRAGLRDDTERFLRAAEVFLFPSRREGFGAAIVEAMACGLPCVVAELAGITDFIFERPASGVGERQTPPPDGIVVPQESGEALAAAALALLGDDARRQAIGAAARDRAAARFSIDGVAADYVELYAALTARRRGGAAA